MPEEVADLRQVCSKLVFENVPKNAIYKVLKCGPYIKK
jgi:hypothetical protein